jgi:hypothetical protein
MQDELVQKRSEQDGNQRQRVRKDGEGNALLEGLQESRAEAKGRQAGEQLRSKVRTRGQILRDRP